MLKILILGLVVMSFIGVVYAFEGISIIRSNSCTAVNCIKIADLLKYDNSSQVYSGKFVYDNKTGDFFRQKGMKHSYDFYKTQNSTVVFVLPDEYTMQRTKKVIIQPSLGEFVIATQKNKKQLDSLTDIRFTSKGMFANQGCTEVTIGIKQVNVSTALAYLANDCPDGQTPLLNKFITNKTKVDHCGNDCQHKKFMKEAKQKSKLFLLPFKKTLR